MFVCVNTCACVYFAILMSANVVRQTFGHLRPNRIRRVVMCPFAGDCACWRKLILTLLLFARRFSLILLLFALLKDFSTYRSFTHFHIRCSFLIFTIMPCLRCLRSLCHFGGLFGLCAIIPWH